MDAAATYSCPACGASTDAIVTGLDDPSTFVSDRDRRVLRDIDAIRREPSAADPVASLEQRILADQAQRGLRFATCPRCGAKNPEGIAHQAAEARRTLITALALAAIGVPALWYAPWLTVVIGAGNALLVLFLALHGRRSGRSIPYLRLALSIAVAAATAAVGLVLPRFAPALPVLWILPTLLRRGRGREEQEEQTWSEARDTIRFEVAGD